MKPRPILTILALFGLALALTVPPGQTQGPGPQGDASVQADLGTAFTYQGQLKSGGEPLTGACDLQFNLWDAARGGAQIGTTQTKANVAVSNGYFTVQELDFGSVFTGDARWLQIAVRCPAGSGMYTNLSPRQALTATPYALGLRPGSFIQGSVGLGGIVGADNTSTGLLSYGLGGTSAGGIGVYGKATATAAGFPTTGVWGESNSPEGRGVAGYANAISGAAYGVYGESASNGGFGVYATAPWRGVVGYATATSGANIGVYGESASTSGSGVYGYATASSGRTIGVWGESFSTAGVGVYGSASASSGYTAGVLGRSDSTLGHGVIGWNTANSGSAYGVYGRSDSADGIGVVGVAGADIGYAHGVYGETSSLGGHGVYGYAKFASAYGGYFYGKVHVTGDLTASGSKSFKIDHPLDPSHRYLSHFAQEAPEVQNVYNGVVTLDAQGEATVILPTYFAALNTGPFRYQLTAIGAAMPNLHIAQEVQGNTFRIAGGVPGKKVSWEVTAVRNDPYTRDHPAQAEVDKSGEEQGTYLYPEGYGQPPEMGLDYQRHARLFERGIETPPDITEAGKR